MVIVNILVFLISLSLVIILHELGHFIMARKAGILCHEFAIGMGPVVWKTKKGETTYLIKLIPIGGYVMMSGEEMDDEVVKLHSDVRIEFEDGIISKIYLDHDDEKYENFEKVTVERIDLKGKEGTPLYLNEYEVKRDAFYVFKNKEVQIAPYDRGFNGKTLGQRFWAIFAGPAMNFVLAFFVFLLVNLIVGFPNTDTTVIGSVGSGYPADAIIQEGDQIVQIEGVDVSTWEELSAQLKLHASNRTIDIQVIRDGSRLDLEPITPTIYYFTIGVHSAETTVEDVIIGTVPEDTPAYKAGFVVGDRLVSVDGNMVSTWQDFSDEITALSLKPYVEGKAYEFVVEREGVELTLDVVEPFTKAFLDTQGISVVDTRIGISPEYNFSLGGSLVGGFKDVGRSAGVIFTTLELLFDNENAGAGVGIDNLAGPLGIYEITSAALSNGFISLLSWIGLLSVNLGIINLLPIPALDGGRLVFLGYELVARRKPNRKFENTLNYIVFVLLMGFFIFVTYNDILRLFNIN